MEFKYTASTAEGSLVNGVVEAESETTAEEILWKSGLHHNRFEEEPKVTSFARDAALTLRGEANVM